MISSWPETPKPTHFTSSFFFNVTSALTFKNNLGLVSYICTDILAFFYPQLRYQKKHYKCQDCRSIERKITLRAQEILLVFGLMTLISYRSANFSTEVWCVLIVECKVLLDAVTSLPLPAAHHIFLLQITPCCVKCGKKEREPGP